MGTVITNLKARFGADTSDLKKGMKDGAQAVDDFKDAAGNSVEKLADLFGINMGAVNSTMATAQKSLNFLGQSFKAGAEGGNKFALAMRVVKTALISTGIGALVVAIGSLAAYFTKSGEGADKLAVALAQIKSVIDTTIERAAVLGKGLLQIVTGKFKEGWETMKGAVNGFGEELREGWKASGDLEKREQELYRTETNLIASLEQRRVKMEELMTAARDSAKSLEEQQAAQKAAIEVRRSMLNDEMALEQDRLAIMQEKLDLQTKDPTREQLREIVEQEANINKLRADGLRDIRGMIDYQTTLTKKIKEKAEEEKKAAAEALLAWNKMVTTAQPATPQLFDMSKINAQLAEVKGAVTSTISSLGTQLSSIVMDSLVEVTAGIGEMLGSLAISEGGLDDFGKKIASVFGDMAITVGTLAIRTGFAIKGIKIALKSMQPGVAIAAGIALVALGTMVKGSLARAAAGSSVGGSDGLTAGGSATYDLRNIGGKPEPVKLSGDIELRVRGEDLWAVMKVRDNHLVTNAGTDSIFKKSNRR